MPPYPDIEKRTEAEIEIYNLLVEPLQIFGPSAASASHHGVFMRARHSGSLETFLTR